MPESPAPPETHEDPLSPAQANAIYKVLAKVLVTATVILGATIYGTGSLVVSSISSRAENIARTVATSTLDGTEVRAEMADLRSQARDHWMEAGQMRQQAEDLNTQLSQLSGRLESQARDLESRWGDLRTQSETQFDTLTTEMATRVEEIRETARSLTESKEYLAAIADIDGLAQQVYSRLKDDTDFRDAVAQLYEEHFLRHEQAVNQAFRENSGQIVKDVVAAMGRSYSVQGAPIAAYHPDSKVRHATGNPNATPVRFNQWTYIKFPLAYKNLPTLAAMPQAIHLGTSDGVPPGAWAIEFRSITTEGFDVIVRTAPLTHARSLVAMWFAVGEISTDSAMKALEPK